MIALLLAGCVHTPPHPPLAEPVTVRLAAVAAVADAEGRDCSWEEEALFVGERRVFGADPPDASDWCTEPFVHWGTVDVLGQDGRFVSVWVESEAGNLGCVTWDVEALRPALLGDYDEDLVVRRLKQAERLLARRRSTARFDANQFYVRGGHVVFCLFDERGTRHDLEVR